MSSTSQNRALARYRRRLTEKGMARFEVLGHETDRELLRWVAKRLAANDSGAAQIRAALRDTAAGVQSKRGGILEALRQSPLVGANLDLRRPRIAARKVEL